MLYSSLWISLCAAAQVQLTYDLAGLHAPLDIFTVFVFASTLALYSLHRIVGIKRMATFRDAGRFKVIRKFRSHIVLYGIAGAVVSGYLLLRLPPSTWLYLIAPVVLSILYVLPVTSGSGRLREIPFAKIFLVAINWSLLTTVIPLLNQGIQAPHLWVIFAERFLFVFAITLPFDIRDIAVDSRRVRTIPMVIGPVFSRWLAIVLLGLSLLLVLYLVSAETYPSAALVPFVGGYMVAAILIRESHAGRDDHYFSGLVDGTLFLIPFLVWVWLRYIN